MIASQIAATSHIPVGSVTDAQIDTYISDMKYDQLIKTIKSVSTLNSSVIDDDLIVKSEYATLIDLVQKAKDAENKMKGKK